MKRIASVAFLFAAAALAGCANPVKVAQKKSVEAEGQKLEFGGEYNARGKSLSLTINGDPVLAGTFPPYTPTLRLNGKYQGMDVSADCYFGSVLGQKGGVVGIVAGAVQGATGKGADKCDMLVGGKVLEALYF
ncbi:MAG: hypothetical protein AB1430_23375 [Pseudomonadota bacterium]